MRYASFRRPDGTPAFGRLAAGNIVDLAGHGGPASLRAALAAGTLATLPDGRSYAAAEVALLPVIPEPGKILCVGLNYETHRQETGRRQAAYPAIFTRWADTLVAAGAPLIRPRETERFDYEGELAVIIGTGGRRIPRDRALAHVAGYSIFNDASVRDWQGHNSQFTPGKNFPSTGALGPALVTADEIPDLAAQRITTRLNGSVVQDQPIADMIWDVAAIIEYLSTFTALAPGDVIATGTPGGVGDRRTPPLYMQGGDLVEVAIGVIGTLSNPVIDDPQP